MEELIVSREGKLPATLDDLSKFVLIDQGQETMIRRFIADSAKAGKQSIYIIADHTITNPSEDIYLKDCIVRDICVYEDKNVNIRPPRTPNMTVKQCYDQWIDYIDTQKNE